MIAPKVILITDPAYSLERIVEVIEAAAGALARGEFMVQLRDKKTARPLLAKTAERLRAVTKEAGALFAINTIRPDAGYILDIAENVGADGVHIECSMTGISAGKMTAVWVSVPTHDDRASIRAHTFAADAVLVSPIFLSPGKPKPRGLSAIHRARTYQSRVYALGGVTVATAGMCATAGAHGVAVIRALLDAEDPAAAARALAAPFVSKGPASSEGAGEDDDADP